MQYVLHMSSQYGKLRPINGWYLLAILGHPCKFQRVLRLGFVTAAMSLTGGQTNFARYLADSWAATLCIHFWGLFPPDRLREFCPVQNSLCRSLAFSYIGSITAQHSSSGRQPNFAVWNKEWNYWTFTEGATYIWQGGHHVGHRPTF